jgi:hypothetical protein
MKPFAIILIILVLAAVVGIGWLYFNANLTVVFDSCIATDGVSQAEYFDQLKKQVSGGTFIGTLYGGKDLLTADQYQFLTYTLHFNNHSFLKAEVIEIRITPMQGDVIQIGEEYVHDLPAGQQMDLTATIMTARNMHAVREATVTWYFWGLPFSLRTTYRHAS